MMKIGELARRTGVSIRMLRYYEQEGLLAPDRQESGYRDYSESDETAVRRIQMLTEAGLKLDAIRQLLPCILTDDPSFQPCDNLRAILQRERRKLDAQIDSLQVSRDMLGRYIDQTG
ncbi:transcriptional regulator, MerR family [Acetobacter tropicalis NBRC 101654]|uniref:Transcriptional regulator, MerR family n=1 Tax=Acetobacter tropicalis NBRC 101654 TaxID=749388 RepID=F7VH22_9PROT|nr:MerR family transcriptional regulator [Acetobacter tropicalis]GAA09667.1 transcriptional regulator, MerR family [Acetobacter tropicalis NBRC 101654]